MADELTNFDAVGLGELIRQKEISPMELLETTIERIERLNPKLNAVIHKMYDQAREAAQAWSRRIEKDNAAGVVFAGVPFLLKDLTAECQGAPFNEGCRALQGYVSKLDSELVRRQKAAGLIILGKTNTPEFGLLPTTEPLLYGPTKNPWNPQLTPGGSSGGSAAAVAARVVPMAHGNDGRRLDPRPGLLLRSLRPQADARPEPSGTALRRHDQRARPRTCGNTHREGFGGPSGCHLRAGARRSVLGSSKGTPLF